ncbi:MAG: zinc-ribbon domain-containing protein [Alphaproteobacteria bacterium]|nr:zinc-ribbon domain-containing protein [Alphaproteobacteria bacterium]
MIVTCPSCSTRYLVETQKLGAQGRMVRCGSCEHTWYQAPPEDAPPRVEVTGPAPEPQPAGVERGGLPAIPKKPRRRGAAVVVLLVLLLALAGAGWGVIFLRDRVMAVFPQTAQFYSRLGLATSTPDFGPGLELRNVAPRRTAANGQPVLVIDGQIVNLSSSSRRVPLLRATLRDANDKPLASWTFSTGINNLAPGAVAPFHTIYNQPMAQATGVVVTLETPAK